jgi:CRP/FNR family transcriptional regulator, cyclic AMP receptor protein
VNTTALTAASTAVTKRRAPLSPSHDHKSTQRPDRSDVLRALITSGIFSRTNSDAVAALSEQLKLEQFSPGCVVGAQRNFAGRLYVIISGKVMVSYRRPDGREFALTVLGPSEIFCGITLFDPDSPELTVTALTEVRAVPIERDRLLAWMARRPEVRDQVLRLFARWVKAMTDSLVDFMFADAQSRIASRLLSLRKRFGWRDGEVVRLVHDLTLEDFSLLAGVAPETTAATLREFEYHGWIRLENNSVVILNGHALSQVRLMRMSEVRCA